MSRVKKTIVIDLRTPWYWKILLFVIDSLSYPVDTKESISQKTIECDVELSNGVKGVASFRDLFEIDQIEGKFTMWVTALKQYQAVKYGKDPNVIVRFSQDPEDWEPVPKEAVVSWGEPRVIHETYPRKLYAVKMFGLILRYEEKRIE